MEFAEIINLNENEIDFKILSDEKKNNLEKLIFKNIKWSIKIKKKFLTNLILEILFCSKKKKINGY